MLFWSGDPYSLFWTRCSIPRWSSGYDSALSQPRAGFDSPSGKAIAFGCCLSFLLLLLISPSRLGSFPVAIHFLLIVRHTAHHFADTRHKQIHLSALSSPSSDSLASFPSFLFSHTMSNIRSALLLVDAEELSNRAVLTARDREV